MLLEIYMFTLLNSNTVGITLPLTNNENITFLKLIYQSFFFNKKITFLTGSFQQLDKEGSGEAELNLTEVSSVSKETPNAFCHTLDLFV